MTFQIYKDAAGEWRWRLCAHNQQIIADGAEGYVSKRNVLRAVKKLVDALFRAFEVQDIHIVEVHY